MTREEIALFLDLEEGFTSTDAEQKYSKRLNDFKRALAQAGSKPARMLAKSDLNRFEQKRADIYGYIEQAGAVEEAEKQLVKLDAYLSGGKVKLASVPYGRLKEINRNLLPQELQDRIDEVGVVIDEESRKAELAARAEERAEREADERARREAEAERKRIEQELRSRREAEEKAKLEAESAAKKAAEEDVRKLWEARERKDAEQRAKAEEQERQQSEEAERLSRDESMRKVRELAEKEAREKAEREAREQAERLSSEASPRVIPQPILDEGKASETVVAEHKAAILKIASLVSRGEYDQAADVICENFKGPVSASARVIWERDCLPELRDTAGNFVSMRIVEARIAGKSGYKAAVGPLLDVIAKVSAFLPPMREWQDECARLKSHLNPSVPKSTPCDRLTIEYFRGDMEKRRLHVLTKRSASFGRSTSSDVVVRVMASMGDADRVNRLIGRCHFTVENSGTFVNIIDGSRAENGTIKASTNGVFIDGKRLVYPRSIDGRGETLHLASQQLASHVAHWSLRLVDGNSMGMVPDSIRAIHPEGKWPRIAGLYMGRMDEMAEDVLFVWDAVPLGIVDQSLSKFWLVNADGGVLLWDGNTMRDVTTAGNVLRVLSAGRLSHIGG